MISLPPICIPRITSNYNLLMSVLVEQQFGDGVLSFVHAAQSMVGRLHQYSWLHLMHDGSKVVYSYISESDAVTLLLLLLNTGRKLDCEIEDYCELLEEKPYL